MLYERQFRESPSTTPPARRASVPRADASDRRRPAVYDTSASPASTWGACPTPLLRHRLSANGARCPQAMELRFSCRQTFSYEFLDLSELTEIQAGVSNRL